ncbi:MAG: hypothetical protein Q7S00_07315 [bacterium]|nr:hypothetical protein [bacterium]
MKMKTLLLSLVLLCPLLFACSSASKETLTPEGDEIPKGVEVGNPETIKGKLYALTTSSGLYDYQARVLDGTELRVSQLQKNDISSPLETVTATYTFSNNQITFQASFSNGTQINIVITVNETGTPETATIGSDSVPSEAVEVSTTSSVCAETLTTKDEIRALIQSFDYIDYFNEDGSFFYREYGVIKPEATAAIKAGCNASRYHNNLEMFMDGFLCEIGAKLSFYKDPDIQTDVHNLEGVDLSSLQASCAALGIGSVPSTTE